MRKLRTKGFTLIELLIVVALVAVVAGLMYSLFGQGLRLYSLSTESADEQQNLRQVLSEITNRVRLADAGDISYSDGVLTIEDVDYQLVGNEVLRDDAVIARQMTAFEVSISSGLLHITITNTKGSQISTTLSLAG